MQPGGLKVLMISSDRNILTPGSAVAERMKEYGALVEELHIVLLSDARHGLKETQLDRNIWVYPTSSFASFLRPLDAVSLGKKIVLEKKFTRGRALITADSLECGWAGLQIKKRWRLPLEVQLHTDIFSPAFKGFQNNARKYFSKKVLRGSDSIRVVTQLLAKRISEKFSIGTDKFLILPIYIQSKKLEEESIPFDLHNRFGWKFIILSAARLTPEKNISLAIRVLQKVLERYPEAGLAVVGDGLEKEPLMGLAKKLNVDKNVAFVGWQEQMAPYYKTANVFLQTSRFEGYGLALIEAGLAGLPVVTTPVGVALEFADGKEIMMADPTAEALAERVLVLISDGEKARAMAAEMKRVLETKLVSKEMYLERLKENWEQTAARIPA